MLCETHRTVSFKNTTDEYIIENNNFIIQSGVTKKNDGPDQYLILFDQILFLFFHSQFQSKQSIYQRFNAKIIHHFQKKIIQDLLNIIFSFQTGSSHYRSSLLFLPNNPIVIQQLNTLISIFQQL